ncbi:MAG: putative lipopolysaccharide heptosyltransferase III [Magnetococcus sp. DMHC-6]
MTVPKQKNLNTYGDYPDLTKVKKAVIIIIQNIGDVILTTPVFSTLKKQFPEMRLDAIVNKGTEDILLGNPFIHTVHVYERQGSWINKLNSRLRLFSLLRQTKYDMAIALTVATRDRTLCMVTGAAIRVGGGKAQNRFLPKTVPFTHKVRHPVTKRYYLERHLDCLRRIGVYPTEDQRLPTIFEGEEAQTNITKRLNQAGLATKSYIVIHPTSRWMFKCWLPEKVAQLMARLHEEFHIALIMTAAPDERELEYIRRLKMTLPTPILDLSGQLTLRQLTALIRQARLFIGVDSAPMHMAVAVQTPSVVLFGPSSEFDWGARGALHHLVVSDQFTCRPCQIDGCGGGKISECLSNISVDQVMTHVRKQLEDPVAPASMAFNHPR